MSLRFEKASVVQTKSERKMTLESTLSQLQSSIDQLKKQAKGCGIDLPNDRNHTLQHEAVKRNIFLALPHTQICASTERGPVGQKQEKNNSLSEKRRGRATRKDKKKQIRSKVRESLIPPY